LARQKRADDALYVAWVTFRIVLIVLFGAGALWLLVTIVRYFWTHPLF